MKKAVWCVCRNEEFYIDMAIQSVLDHVDGVLILDTGSTDRTMEIVRSFKSDKIVLVEKDFGSDVGFRFGPRYDEVGARNHAMDLAIEAFKPDYLIQLDADEVYNEMFFKILNVMNADSLGHSTDLPVSPVNVYDQPGNISIWNGAGFASWNGIHLFDPHVRSWAVNLNVRWESRTGADVIPRATTPSCPDYLETPNRLLTTEKVHFHLHRAFGPKSITAYLTNFKHAYTAAGHALGIPYDKVFSQDFLQQMFPDWFGEDGRFRPKKEVIKKLRSVALPCAGLPQFVIDRWNKWGDWSEFSKV